MRYILNLTYGFGFLLLPYSNIKYFTRFQEQCNNFTLISVFSNFEVAVIIHRTHNNVTESQFSSIYQPKFISQY
jgi:hypothetical protein